MLNHPTLEKLQTLRLFGMLKALTEQMNMPEIETLSFEERLGLLAEREITEREDRRLKTRLRQAKLRQNACIEDIDYRAPRGLDKALILQLAGCRWIHEGLNLIINGPTIEISDGQLDISGDITGTGGLTKTDSATLVLSGVNTYTNETRVNGGTLLVNGSTAAGSTVEVGNGATLGGTGRISGSWCANCRT